jgi:hypothetical protein
MSKLTLAVLAACADLKEADPCAFELHDHDITGTCVARPDDKTQLACRPDHPPPHPDGSDAPPSN